MASVTWGSISQYFDEGGSIEISCNERGFHGSWYPGTLIRPPKEKKSTKVLVEYSTLMEDKAGTRPLREVVKLMQVRPAPPRENRLTFNRYMEVDAFYHGGWWAGVIRKVKREKYKVFFRGSREELSFEASRLRIHREWAFGEWLPDLEDSPVFTSPDEETPFPTEVKAEEELIEHIYSPGELVEVSTDEEGLQGAWFAATVIKTINEGKYLIEHNNLRNDDDTNFLREEVDGLHIRPFPPDIGLVDRFELHDQVDALYNDGWWAGMISKVLKNDRYYVYFRSTEEELKFEHSDLRVHQEWRNGKWQIASKVVDL